MKSTVILCVLLLLTAGSNMTAANSPMKTSKKIRVLLWSEQTEPRDVYPTGISGALASHLNKLPNLEARTATLTDAEAGLSDATLADTDVLIWFGHRKHDQVPEAAVDRVVRHVRERGMGFIGLHSTHFAKPLKKILNASGAWSSYVNHGQPEQMWVVLPDHPIAKGVSDFRIPKTEIYTEPFQVPTPEAVIVEGTWEESGHRGREVMTWTTGRGRMVYVRAGHEEYPIFHMPEMQRLVANSVEWAAGQTNATDGLKRREAGPVATATGPHQRSRQARRQQEGASAMVVVLNKMDDTVDMFNTQNGEKIGTVKTGTHPHEVAISPDGSTAYVTLYGSGVYGKNPMPNNKLAVINLKTKREETQIDLSPYKSPHGIAVDPKGMVWVTCENDAAIIVIDPKERKVVAAIPTGTNGTHWIALLPDGSKAYTSNKETTKISVIDTAARKVIKEIPVPRGVEGIGTSPDGSRLYAGDFLQPVLFVIDTAKDEVMKEVQLKNKPGRVRVTPDNRSVLISSYGAGAIEVVDVSTLTSRKVIPVGKAPMGIAFSADDRYAFVANSGETSASVIDLQTMEVVHTVTTGNGPDGIAFAETK